MSRDGSNVTFQANFEPLHPDSLASNGFENEAEIDITRLSPVFQ
ncbi:MAG TPA: hypothetical protein PKD66_15275 [Azonexus sp.]|nr:hypothetical protein [Azonexus sp.]